MHHTPPLDWWINNVVMVRFLLSGTHALPLLLLHTYFSFLTSLSLCHCAFFPFPFSSRWVQPRSSQTGEKRQRQQPLTWPPSSHRGDAARVRRPLVLAHRRRGWHLSRIAGHRLVQRASYPPSRWCESQQETTGRERRKRWQEPQSERETELNFWGKKKKKKKERPFFAVIFTPVYSDAPCVDGHRYHVNTAASHAGVPRHGGRDHKPIFRLGLRCCCHAREKRTRDELDVDDTLLS